MDSIKNKSFVKEGSSSGENKNNGPKNIFANANSAIQKQMEQFKKPPPKGGQSLGGSKPGRLISISLSQPGALGVEVEKRKDASQSAIVASVIPDSQAEKAGLKRGDIVCHADSDREFSYNEFLKVAKSGARPLRFNVRRMESTLVQDGKGSADAMHRKQAMIAAAEAREAKHRAFVKPVPKYTEADRFKLRGEQQSKPVEYTESNNEETHRAVEAVKAAEKSDAENLGYNPYEARAITSGQARTATVAMTKGDINAENTPIKLRGERGETTTPGKVSAPLDPTNSIPIEFDYAFSTLVTSSSDASATKKSLSTMRKLITNAITKGQQGDDATSSKFRRVRLSNPKIKEAITDMQGALELMMAAGFVLSENEEDGETYLVFPPEVGAEWLDAAVERMEEYERGG